MTAKVARFPVDKTARRAAKYGTDQSKRMLALDILGSALTEEINVMMIALGVLLGSKILAGEERGMAEFSLEELTRLDEQYSIAFAWLKPIGDSPPELLRSGVVTLLDDIAARRETAFWSLTPNGVVDVEKIIAAQLDAYHGVRLLMRVILAKDFANSYSDEPPDVPVIPQNRYLRLIRPELVH